MGNKLAIGVIVQKKYNNTPVVITTNILVFDSFPPTWRVLGWDNNTKNMQFSHRRCDTLRTKC